MVLTLPALSVSGGMILSDEVYAAIGAAILDGRLHPGERLRDVDLAAQLGVSRTPVREALQRLERFGLVEIAVGRYTRVSKVDDALRQDTGEFTAYFLGSALRLALKNTSDEELAPIVAAADAVVDAASQAQPLQLFEASAILFELVTHATGNTVFVGVMREAALAMQRNLRDWRPFLACPLARAQGYGRLRDCIAARDADGAEQLMRELHGLV